MANPQDHVNPSKCAKDYIAAFKSGEDFQPPSTGLIVDGQPDSMAIWILGSELTTANSNVRENIVELLAELGMSSDTLQTQGCEVLQNLQIIEILISSGLEKSDLGQEASIDALRKHVPISILNQYKDEFIKTLENEPSIEALLLIAKSKPPRAKILVDRLAILPEWKDVDEMKIAQSALGAVDFEDEYLGELESAVKEKDGVAFGEALVPLTLIGTNRSLKAVSEHLRTPLTIIQTGAFEKSCRLDVLEALLYNFPEESVLYPNNIVTEADYTAAERFCEQTYGVTYTTPPPPFMTYRGFPTQME